MNFNGHQFEMLNGESWIPVMNFNQGYPLQAGYQAMASFQCEYCHKLYVHKEQFDRHVLSHEVETIVAGSRSVSQGARDTARMVGAGDASRSQGDTARSQEAGNLARSPGTPGSNDTSRMQGPCDTTRTPGSDMDCSPEAGPSTNGRKPQHRVTPVSKVTICRPKLYACDECPKSYTRKDHLSRHKLWHIGDRPHVCSVCFKSFIRKDKLIRHEKIHGKETHYNCNVCGKHFIRKDSMNKHIRMHDMVLEGKPRRTSKKNTSQQTDDVAVMDQMYSSPTQTGPTAPAPSLAPTQTGPTALAMTPTSTKAQTLPPGHAIRVGAQIL